MVPRRIVAPYAATWTEATLISGILAHVPSFHREDYRALLHDALMLPTMIGARAVLISRNTRHMDMLLRLRPDPRILLYDRPVPRVAPP